MLLIRHIKVRLIGWIFLKKYGQVKQIGSHFWTIFFFGCSNEILLYQAMNPRNLIICLVLFVDYSLATEFNLLLNHGECLIFTLTGNDGKYRSFNLNVSQFPLGVPNSRNIKLQPRYISSVEIQNDGETDFLVVSTDSGLYNVFHYVEDGLVIQPVASTQETYPRFNGNNNFPHAKNFDFTSEL